MRLYTKKKFFLFVYIFFIHKLIALIERDIVHDSFVTYYRNEKDCVECVILA